MTEEQDRRMPEEAELPEVDPEEWGGLGFIEQRERLAGIIRSLLPEGDVVRSVVVEAGPPGRPFDLTAVVETDVGRLRTPLWSDARATLFLDDSVHPANRLVHGPVRAAREAAARLRSRLAVPYSLESRGLTFSHALEPGATRTWTAEHSLFRKRTAVTREDRVERAGDLDVRDLLAHFYTGPSLRLVSETGEAFLLPAAGGAEGPLVTLCPSCARWQEGAADRCPHCGSDAVDVVVAARAPGESA